MPREAVDELRRLDAQYGSAEATGAVGEDDFWGVEATAQRIFDFAVALSGGDVEKMETLKEVVQKAFEKCEKLCGKTLPDISYRTCDRVDALFDAYAARQRQYAEQ